ncbi:hypothetical protein HN51_032488 [Arachis hypogaea]|uniref:RING-type E3 ubiquitin transferase n=2 Tax=Arachis TaxID=3817 RepID=A0A445B4K6_ARAHY|nr:putative RING-H2 finger protein ATL12 [Arachis duranensis]QHO16807.1 Putative RING-H2 finger protein [Arachis hypogaea]RYR33599.1 hypothetical protein Ahy_A10g048208 [Arachis hypogaea]
MIIKNHFFMSMIMFTFTMVYFLFSVVHAQNNDEDMAPEMSDTLHPSKALVISVLTVIFTITFFLLAYVRFCRFNPVVGMSYPNPNNIQGNILTRNGSRFSGINRELVEKLPFFRFSSLKGSKEGLECTVCLSKFEDSEVLRLLPKCQHAFHINCIDKWLESHSTCPLCRYRVEPGDIKSNVRSLSFGSLRVPSNLTEESNLEIYIQREPSHRRSSRFGFLEFSKSKKQEEEGGSGSNSNNNNDMNKNNHKFNHRIVISDVVTRSRWSDLNSSDLLSLSMEMLNDASSARFSPEKIVQGEYSVSVDDEDENSFTALNSSNKNKDCGEKRSMSEIANVPRFAEIMTMKKQNSSSGGVGREEERFLRIWMPIARRTVQWFARRQRNYYDAGDELRRHKHLGSNV